jgi:hypothetical protein
MTELPLFPLKTVLLPSNKLRLKIFEPRYLDMIARCMREESKFGVVLIYKGEESLSDTDIYSVGTTATISDWENRADGLLSITALGIERFQIKSTHIQSDGLTIAEIEILKDTETSEMPEQYTYMQELLHHISAQEGRIPNENQSFSEILYQLIYWLPLESNLKQRLLEIADGSDRAAILHAELIRLGVIQYVKPDIKLG